MTTIEWAQPFPEILPGGFNSLYESGRICRGHRVEVFEHKLEEYFGIDSDHVAVCCNSGTSALLTLLMLMPDHDKIRYPANAFWIVKVLAKLFGRDSYFPRMNVISHDVDQYGCMDFDTVPDDSSLLIPIDFGGHPCDHDKVSEFSEHVCFDGCESFGTTWRGKSVFSLYDYSCISFHGLKQMTTLGEGGAMFVPKDREEDARRIIDCGHKVAFGLNLRMTDLQAYVGTYAIETIGPALERRREIWKMYQASLPSIPLREHGGHGHLWYVLPVDKDPKIVEDELRKRDIIAIQRFPYVHDMQEKAVEFSRNVTLPLHCRMSNADVNYVIAQTKEVLEL